MIQDSVQPTQTKQQRALVFGATGAIGQPVCALLLRNGWQVTAITRKEILPSVASIEWRYGALPSLEMADEEFDVIISCGPLDLFSLWFTQSSVRTKRVIAFSSTSVHVKQLSPEPVERAIAGRLRESEARLECAVTKRGVTAALLRPTLVYGAAMDRNISRIAAIAQRFGFFVLPGDALGLRQPVHVGDLAQAVIAAIPRVDAGVRSYDLPGGETLSYREMTQRILSGLQPPARLLIVPGIFFSVIAHVARMLSVQDAGAAVLARMRHDLIFDDSAARRELGYDPRSFSIDISMLKVR